MANRATGFLRMQRLGIPRPPFRIEDSITRKLKKLYKDHVQSMVLEFVEEALNSNAEIKGAKITMDADIRHEIASAVAEHGDVQGYSSAQINKSAIQAALNTLKNRWFEDAELSDEIKEELRKRLNIDLESGKNNFYKQFFKDADLKTRSIFTSFSLDKRAVFENHINELKNLYLDNAIERIQGEENELKRMFLKKLVNYVSGTEKTLDIAAVAKDMSQTSGHVAQFFARDQLARFNKALTVSTFQTAGATRMKWCTCHDKRVRPSHAALDGKIFDVANPPPEIDDYNCRCGLIPVWE